MDDARLFHTGFGSREREERPDTCPKCKRDGEFRYTKFYRICKCGHTVSRLTPRKGRKPEGVEGLK